jgi:hypothetical protein
VNYTTLFNTIKTYTENEFPSTSFTGTDGVTTVTTLSNTQVNTFISQAETRIYNAVNIPALRRNVTGTVTAGNPYLSLPTDWLSAYSVAVYTNDFTTPYTYLLNKDVNFIREAYPYPAVSGTPKYYALFGTQYNNPNALSYILGPTPDVNYQVEMHYFYYPASIVTAGESWLGDNYDPVLLYGCLLEAAVFMKAEQDVVGFYTAKYQEAMNELRRLCDALERGDSYRDGQLKLNAAPKGGIVQL